METPTEEQKNVFLKIGKALQNLAPLAARQQNATRQERHIVADAVKVSLKLEDSWKVRLRVTYDGDVYESTIDYSLLTFYKLEDLPTIFVKDLDKLIARI